MSDIEFRIQVHYIYYTKNYLNVCSWEIVFDIFNHFEGITKYGVIFQYKFLSVMVEPRQPFL